MKTHDEIKKGLDYCSRHTCSENGTDCPYENGHFACIGTLTGDALALIQQKEQENAEQAERIRQLVADKAELLEKVEQLQAERDAAVEDIKEAHDSYCGCVTCKNYRVNADCQEPPDTFCPNCSHDDCPCKGCSSNLEKWQWRGVQKEE